MSTENFDIIHIEDEEDGRDYVKHFSKKNNLTYLGIPSLNELEIALEQNRAKIWIIDGKFPAKEGDVIEFNAPKAVELIRNKYGSNVKIIIYSGEPDIDLFAKKINVISRKKGANYNAKQIVEEVKGMINAISE